MMRANKIFLILFFIGYAINAGAQDMSALVQKVKAKLDLVNDYVADGKNEDRCGFY
ncbi:MAG TPA: hypothetical protein VHP12_05550 [Chitinophagaceae bacterium]|nr:hypothetical protein [Chitinophagaceae bacterium]